MTLPVIREQSCNFLSMSKIKKWIYYNNTAIRGHASRTRVYDESDGYCDINLSDIFFFLFVLLVICSVRLFLLLLLLLIYSGFRISRTDGHVIRNVFDLLLFDYYCRRDNAVQSLQ